MSLYDASDEFEDADWTPRPIVLPTFRLPVRAAAMVAWGLLAAAVLAMVAGLVAALSFRLAVPSGAGAGAGPEVNLFQPTLGTADRISLFAGDAASLTIALLVVFAVIVAAMARRQDETGRSWSLLLGATAIIAGIVVLADVAQAIVILDNATGEFTATSSANKASSILNLLPPVLSAAAALFYAVTRLRTSGREVHDDGPDGLSPI